MKALVLKLQGVCHIKRYKFLFPESYLYDHISHDE